MLTGTSEKVKCFCTRQVLSILSKFREYIDIKVLDESVYSDILIRKFVLISPTKFDEKEEP